MGRNYCEIIKYKIDIPRSEIEYSTNDILYIQKMLFEKIGKKAVITDFAILLGGYAFVNLNGSLNLKDRCGWYWTKAHNIDEIKIINEFGNIKSIDPTFLKCGIRPVIGFHTPDYVSRTIIDEKIVKVEYGFYPQTAVSNDLQKELEDLYKNRKLTKTKISYSIPESFKSYELEKYANHNANNFDKNFDFVAYKYNQLLYIRMPVHFDVLLSNEVRYQKGDYVWIEVEPITWLIDKENYFDSIMMTEKIILAGIPYVNDKLSFFSFNYMYPEHDFGLNLKQIQFRKEEMFYDEESEINKFLNDCWFDDINKVRVKEPFLNLNSPEAEFEIEQKVDFKKKLLKVFKGGKKI